MSIGMIFATGYISGISLVGAGAALFVARKVGRGDTDISPSLRKTPKLTIALFVLAALGLALVGLPCLMITKAIVLKTTLPNALLTGYMYIMAGGFLMALGAFGKITSIRNSS